MTFIVELSAQALRRIKDRRLFESQYCPMPELFDEDWQNRILKGTDDHAVIPTENNCFRYFRNVKNIEEALETLQKIVPDLPQRLWLDNDCYALNPDNEHIKAFPVHQARRNNLSMR